MIARRLQCSRDTVAAALELTQPPTSATARRAQCARSVPGSGSRKLLAKYPNLSAVRIHEEIARGPEGYTSSVHVLRRHLRRFGPPAAVSTRKCITNRPKRCRSIGANAAACKWARPPTGVSVFVAVLCYSRLLYIEFTLSQRRAEFYRGLVNALTFFGGSPRNLIFDNLKAAVLNGAGRHAYFHPEFQGLCGYFCLQPVACAARVRNRRASWKGGVRYVKQNALAGRGDELTRFEDYLALALPGAIRSPTSDFTRRPASGRSIALSKSAPVAAAPRHPVRHRRSRAGRGQPACTHRLRRQSLFRARRSSCVAPSPCRAIGMNYGCCTKARS